MATRTRSAARRTRPGKHRCPVHTGTTAPAASTTRHDGPTQVDIIPITGPCDSALLDAIETARRAIDDAAAIPARPLWSTMTRMTSAWAALGLGVPL